MSSTSTQLRKAERQPRRIWRWRVRLATCISPTERLLSTRSPGLPRDCFTLEPTIGIFTLSLSITK